MRLCESGGEGKGRRWKIAGHDIPELINTLESLVPPIPHHSAIRRFFIQSRADPRWLLAPPAISHPASLTTCDNGEFRMSKFSCLPSIEFRPEVESPLPFRRYFW